MDVLLWIKGYVDEGLASIMDGQWTINNLQWTIERAYARFCYI